MVENSPEEIREVVEEFLNQPNPYQFSDLQREFNHLRQVQIRTGLSAHGPDALPRLGVIDKYRYASRCDSSEGTIGQKYLEQNWYADSFGDKIPSHVTV